MTFSRKELQIIRWCLFAASLAILLIGWRWDLRGGWGVLCFFGFLVTGIPAAMLSLYLQPPKFVRDLDRRK